MFLNAVPGTEFWTFWSFFFLGLSLFLLLRSLTKEKISLLIISIFLFTLSLVATQVVVYKNDVYVHPFGFAGLVLLFSILDLIDVKQVGKKIKRLGDISYGTYLWHIPIQISLILILDALGIGREIALTNSFFFLFFFLVIFVANISFIYFENPMRKFIRKKWGGKKIEMKAAQF